MHTQGQYRQTEEGGGIHNRRTQQGTKGQLRHRRTNNQQGSRYGDITYHCQGLTDIAGDVVDAQGHNQHRQVGRQHRRAVENLLIEPFTAGALTTGNHHGTNGKDGKRIDHIQHGSIENGLMSEDRSHHRVAHEAYIAKHHGKRKDATMLNALGQQTGEAPCQGSQHHIGQDTDTQQRQDILTVGQIACHR